MWTPFLRKDRGNRDTQREEEGRQGARDWTTVSPLEIRLEWSGYLLEKERMRHRL